jgi:hypothetical protein
MASFSRLEIRPRISCQLRFHGLRSGEIQTSHRISLTLNEGDRRHSGQCFSSDTGAVGTLLRIHTDGPKINLGPRFCDLRAFGRDLVRNNYDRKGRISMDEYLRSALVKSAYKVVLESQNIARAQSLRPEVNARCPHTVAAIMQDLVG